MRRWRVPAHPSLLVTAEYQEGGKLIGYIVHDVRQSTGGRRGGGTLRFFGYTLADVRAWVQSADCAAAVARVAADAQAFSGGQVNADGTVTDAHPFSARP